jgi:hypothetical protein
MDPSHLELLWNPQFKLENLINLITARPLNTHRLASTAQLTSHRSGNASSVKSDQYPLLDPKPLQKVIDAARIELEKLRHQLGEEIDELEAKQIQVDLTAKQVAAELGNKLNQSLQQFETLEVRVAEVGNTAVRIGEQLETIDRQRARAADVRELLSHVAEFAHGSKPGSKLDALVASGEAGQLRAALLARRMLHVGPGVADVGPTLGENTWANARKHIEAWCARFESSMVSDFVLFSDEADIPKMRHAATVLAEYTAGDACERAWVGGHPLLQLRVTCPQQLTEDKNDSITASPDEGLVKLIETFRATLYQDWDLVVAVFPAPILAMEMLIQRFFNDVVRLFNAVDQQIVPCQSQVLNYFVTALNINIAFRYSLIWINC